MHHDVVELKNFYATPLGQSVRRVLGHRIRARWRGLSGATLIGLGYASPYLGAFRGEARRIGALMPETQGAVVWPKDGSAMSALVEEDRLPLADGSVDRLLAVHCLEVAERTRPLLREMWRVLAPEGRLMLVVPNRRGVWARLDKTPFGQGRPYSRHQLEALLSEAMFSSLEWGGALFVPPFNRAGAAALGNRLGARRRGDDARVCRRDHRGGEERAGGADRQTGKGARAARSCARRRAPGVSARLAFAQQEHGLLAEQVLQRDRVPDRQPLARGVERDRLLDLGVDEGDEIGEVAGSCTGARRGSRTRARAGSASAACGR